MAVPFLISIVMRIIPPIADTLLTKYLDFSLFPYNDLILLMVLFLSPAILGSAYGFLLLDETDLKTIGYYQVLPIGLNGYLIRKTFIPMAYSFLVTPLLIIITSLDTSASTYFSGNLLLKPQFYLLNIIIAIEAGIYALLLSSLAKNKVEGLTLAKGLSMFNMLPILPYFLPNSPFRWLGAFFPMYWGGELFINLENKIFYLFLIPAILLHILAFWFLLKRKLKRIQFLL
jgi:fluoroquinolone transport system permease protein